jgi:uncharacterized protein YkwD
MLRIAPVAALLAALALIAAAIITAPPGARPAAAQATNCTPAGSGGDSTLLGLHNAARADVGVGPLSASATLNSAAQWMAEDMQRVLAAGGSPNHQPDTLGRTFLQRMQQCGVTGTFGENIAWGYGSASSVHTAWMGSPGHRGNILSASYNSAGIGRSGNSWVVIFSSSGGGGGSTSPTPTPTRTPTPAPSPTSSPSPSPTASATATPPTATPSPTASPSPDPSATPSPTPSASPSPSPRTLQPAGFVPMAARD